MKTLIINAVIHTLGSILWTVLGFWMMLPMLGWKVSFGVYFVAWGCALSVKPFKK